MRFDLSKNVPFICLALIIFTGILVHTYFFELELSVSLRGFSVLEVLEALNNPQNFARDYPGGSRLTTLSSIVTHMYHPIQKVTGLSGLTLMILMIALEIFCVACGSFVLWRVLAKKLVDVNEDHTLFGWGYCWLLIVILISSVISPNWANLSFPYFHGQFYGFADALRLSAIAFALERKWKLVAVSLVFGFMIHPIKVLMASIFILVVILYDWRKSINKISVAWGSITFIFFIVWGYLWLGLGQSNKFETILVDDFVAYTRIFQGHWYPLDVGGLTFHHDLILSPFMGLLLMTVLALSQGKWSQHFIQKILLGLAALMIATFLGLWASVDQSSTTLIKICFLRASTLVTLLAPFIILSAVAVKWNESQWHWVALYAVFLLGGFEITKYIYMSPVFALIAVALHIWEQKKSHWWLSLSAIIVIITVGFLWWHYPNVHNPILIALQNFPFVFLVWGSLLLMKILPGWMRIGLSISDFRFLALTLVLLVAGLLWGYGNRYLSDDFRAKARNFQELQLWAKDNTAKDALFMIDPCQYYGWRDFSSRSSIGTPREWYMTGWIYSSAQDVLVRGEEIGKALGLDMTLHRSKRGQKRISNRKDVCRDAQTLYYDPSRQGIKNLVNEFGVNYFIMLREKSDGISLAGGPKPIIQNKYYNLYKAEDLVQ